jgi:hypothetical protein
MGLKKADLKFRITLTLSEYWDVPEIADIKLEGEEQVEQKWYAKDLSIEQFVAVLVQYNFVDSISTQGQQIEDGFIVPAVCMYADYEEIYCYVTVYTDETIKQAEKLKTTPRPTPVVTDIDDDGALRGEVVELGSLPFWGDEWGKVEDAIMSVIPIEYKTADVLLEELFTAISKAVQQNNVQVK